MSGRAATTNVIPGRYALSVCNPGADPPAGWRWVALADLARLESGHTPSRRHPEYWDGDIAWIGIKDARNHHGGVIHETLQTVTQDGIDNSASRVLPAGTVCLSRTASVGYVVVMGREMATSQDFVNWVCGDGLDPHFLKHLLVAEKQSLLEFGEGRVHKTIYFPEVKSFYICIPPLSDQRRIVAKLEALQARSRRARAALEAIPPLLDRFRQSVLAAAFRGDLTADWRAAHPEVEPASVLLERIRVERRRRWEEGELAKMRAQGKVPKGEAWKEKYREAEGVDTAGLPALPEGWCWASLAEIAALKGGITKGQKQLSGASYREVPYLRVANVQRGHLDLAEMKTILAREDVIRELRLSPGDVLFNEGGDRDKLGRGWVWEGQIQECIYQNHVFRGRLATSKILPKFVSLYANEAGQAYFLRTGKQTTNLASINLSNLGLLPVPIPPTQEQSALVQKVLVQLQRIDDVRSAMRDGIGLTSTLGSAVLLRAFRGELFPSGPPDGEPFREATP
jgi:type I restriction enzyme S subunit